MRFDNVFDYGQPKAGAPTATRGTLEKALIDPRQMLGQHSRSAVFHGAIYLVAVFAQADGNRGTLRRKLARVVEKIDQYLFEFFSITR